MLITPEQLQQYTGKMADDPAGLEPVYCAAAGDIVIDYLGYDPASLERRTFLDGTGTKQLSLAAKPVTAVSSVVINGTSIDTSLFAYTDRFLLRVDGNVFPEGERNISVIYTAGYAEIPGIITLTALRIAGIIITEADGNIGITSKSFGDSGTRTFYKTKFDDYLLPIEKYRIYQV